METFLICFKLLFLLQNMSLVDETQNFYMDTRNNDIHTNTHSLSCLLYITAF